VELHPTREVSHHQELVVQQQLDKEQMVLAMLMVNPVLLLHQELLVSADMEPEQVTQPLGEIKAQLDMVHQLKHLWLLE
jgi:hypothetical protein